MKIEIVRKALIPSKLWILVDRSGLGVVVRVIHSIHGSICRQKIISVDQLKLEEKCNAHQRWLRSGNVQCIKIKAETAR